MISLFQLQKLEKGFRIRKESTQIVIGGSNIEIDINYTVRRSMSLKIVPKGEGFMLKIGAPSELNNSEVLTFVRQKEAWIISKIEAISQRRVNQSHYRYVNGEEHLLLGKPIFLKIEQVSRGVGGSLVGDTLTLKVRSEQECEGVLRRWYANQAPKIFAEIITPIAVEFAMFYKVTYKHIEYKYVKSYWGQCNSNGTIRLNIELLRAPKECIEYIMAHELCHLVHPNHSPRFYKLLDEFMPDWSERKLLLNNTITINK